MIEKNRRKKHPRRHPHFVFADPERFYIERMTAGLTQLQACEYLGVTGARCTIGRMASPACHHRM